MSPPRRTLVVLVHGLGGRGYETWGQLPERLFSGADGPAVDIGLEHLSDEDLVARTAAIPGCAVARMAWGHLARDGLGR
jgi:hypothetical protein